MRSLVEGALLCGLGALALAVLEGYLIPALTPQPASLARDSWALLVALAARSALLGMALGLVTAALVTVVENRERAGGSG